MKKIEETDLIFENVQNKKEKALKEETTGLISIDTKDKVRYIDTSSFFLISLLYHY